VKAAPFVAVNFTSTYGVLYAVRTVRMCPERVKEREK
jgi:hypothetical protein